MGLWIAIGLLGLVKLSFAGIMLWLPFRDDQVLDAPAPSSDDDGGSKVSPESTRHPRSPLRRPPRRPRRGPHGSPGPAAPSRTRFGGPRPARTPCRR